MKIEINEYKLSALLPAAPWFVYYCAPNRVAQVQIMTAMEAADLFGDGRAPYFHGEITSCGNRKNAERLARRLRRATGAHHKVGPRRWMNQSAADEQRALQG